MLFLRKCERRFGMTILLILGLVCLIVALAFVLLYGGSTSMGDLWTLYIVVPCLVGGIVMIVASAIWWIAAHFTYQA